MQAKARWGLVAYRVSKCSFLIRPRFQVASLFGDGRLWSV